MKNVCSESEWVRRNELVVKELLSNAPGENDISVYLWNGRKVWGKGEKLKIKLKTPWSLKEALKEFNDLSLAESYIYGLIDLEGDIFILFPIVDWILETFTLRKKLKVWKLVKDLPSEEEIKKCRVELDGEVHSIERDRKAVQYHYDVSNEFYKLFLDRKMVYSCAFFKNYSDSLDKAQEQKLEYICKKLRLKEGEKLLDIGCGWGALILHAAKNYGVQAVGITLSKNQYEFVKEKIKEEKLEDKCTVLLADYRELDDVHYYDKVVSVGMFEHVGKVNALKYFKKIYNLLKEGGVFLNHAISCNYKEYGKPPSQFIRKYVFPDGELLPISTTVEEAEKAGFEIRDVESLREHYTLTLMHWVKRLENNYDKAVRVAGEEKYRIWRLYMASSSYQFLTNRTGLYQTLMVKTDREGNSGFPLTRFYMCF
ncbi:cyclopropane-fatty-acyl-phospholipid synthase [Desulfurobacterium pacificum]|uniref:Cyclopropane-fatty-acyl-phospholipid synthase n=1 Tax=Desulfurobacterium pacificum TaxID=240166 RepID=A0ABY1N946_9BACT|nr:cyclopropane-fatty-acyl-phospholipid synthase family protein [Desulfurobacterium pacificum]SMP03841.1 cyclopropane-fatty-acyl-phospholipid synthase [Desulfurobacterium pacificum]